MCNRTSVMRMGTLTDRVSTVYSTVVVTTLETTKGGCIHAAQLIAASEVNEANNQSEVTTLVNSSMVILPCQFIVSVNGTISRPSMYCAGSSDEYSRALIASVVIQTSPDLSRTRYPQEQHIVTSISPTASPTTSTPTSAAPTSGAPTLAPVAAPTSAPTLPHTGRAIDAELDPNGDVAPLRQVLEDDANSPEMTLLVAYGLPDMNWTNPEVNVDDLQSTQHTVVDRTSGRVQSVAFYEEIHLIGGGLTGEVGPMFTFTSDVKVKEQSTVNATVVAALADTIKNLENGSYFLVRPAPAGKANTSTNDSVSSAAVADDNDFDDTAALFTNGNGSRHARSGDTNELVKTFRTDVVSTTVLGNDLGIDAALQVGLVDPVRGACDVYDRSTRLQIHLDDTQPLTGDLNRATALRNIADQCAGRRAELMPRGDGANHCSSRVWGDARHSVVISGQVLTALRAMVGSYTVRVMSFVGGCHGADSPLYRGQGVVFEMTGRGSLSPHDQFVVDACTSRGASVQLIANPPQIQCIWPTSSVVTGSDAEVMVTVGARAGNRRHTLLRASTALRRSRRGIS